MVILIVNDKKIIYLFKKKLLSYYLKIKYTVEIAIYKMNKFQDNVVILNFLTCENLHIIEKLIII